MSTTGRCASCGNESSQRRRICSMGMPPSKLTGTGSFLLTSGKSSRLTYPVPFTVTFNIPEPGYGPKRNPSFRQLIGGIPASLSASLRLRQICPTDHAFAMSYLFAVVATDAVCAPRQNGRFCIVNYSGRYLNARSDHGRTVLFFGGSVLTFLFVETEWSTMASPQN